jgi:PAS domain S-box-containing protein
MPGKKADQELTEISPEPNAGPQDEVFSGGGEMGARIRAFDWSNTPMGPIAGWPQSLKTAVRILITSRYAMWMGWGQDLTFLYNDAYAHMTLGKKHPWALGKKAGEVWAEIWTDIYPRIRRVLETGESTWDEGLLLFLERSGFPEETYHTFSYSPLTGDDGKINGHLCVVTEETERIIGERQLTFLRSLSSGLSAKITEKDVLTAVRAGLEANRHDLPFTLTYLFENGETRARLACATGISSGHPAAPEIIETESEQEIWPIRNLLKQKGPILVENLGDRFGTVPTGEWEKAPDHALLVPITRQGQDMPAGVLIAALNPYRQRDTNYTGFIDLVAGQIAAGIANARAYDEERKRSEALAAIDSAKTAFFSNVSHEFRTPLTLMLGPTEDALATPEKALRGTDLETVHRNELRLLKLVNTLLDFSRLEAGRVKASYRSTDLAVYTAELASVFRSAMAKAELTYIVEAKPLPHPVFVDHEMWEKIVLNLISNALKSTFEGSITVRIEDKSDHAELTISDTGTGIPEEEISHLFERFRRIENARRRTHEGSGIGLALVNELLAMHGGKIDVQSQMGKGTTFTVSIPYGSRHLPQDRIALREGATVSGTAREALVQEALSWLPTEPSVDDLGPYSSAADLDTTDALSAAPPESGERAKVLLVDDNRDMRDYVYRLLRSRFEVVTAVNGRDALEKAKKQTPDLVLSDVMMPEMDGFELLTALRKDEKTASVPVILLSARASEDARIEGMQSGADDYLVKPFTARELIARVQTHIKIARIRREAQQRESETLRAEQKRLEELYRQAPAFLCVLRGPDHVFEMTNPRYQDLIGNRNVIGKSVPEAVPESVEQGLVAILDKVYQTGEPFVANSFPIKLARTPGQPLEDRYLDFVYQPMRDADNKITGILALGVDVTERRRAEQALYDSEARLSAMYSSMHEYIGLVATDGTVLDCNPASLEFGGNTREEIVGLKYWDTPWFIHTPGAPELLRHAIARTATGEFMRYEASLNRPSGDAMTFDFSLRPVFNPQGEVAFIVPEGRDITELKRAQSALLQSEKLAAVGRLSASIAHEINNPLEAITNLLYLIDRSDELPESLRNFTKMAQQELARVSQIATQTLRFYRQSTAKNAVRVSELLDQVLKLYQGRLTSAGVGVVRDYRSAEPLVCFDGELRQVFTNLIGNALDASREGGPITLREREATDWRTGRKGIRITVADRGHGMSQETVARIFEPFFSTKGITGTGLGLWVSLEIVQKHKGVVKVRSSISPSHHGTVFSVFIPHHAE